MCKGSFLPTNVFGKGPWRAVSGIWVPALGPCAEARVRLLLSGTEVSARPRGQLFLPFCKRWPYRDLWACARASAAALGGTAWGASEETWRFPNVRVEWCLPLSWGSRAVGFVCWLSCQSPRCACPPAQSRWLDWGGGAGASTSPKSLTQPPTAAAPPPSPSLPPPSPSAARSLLGQTVPMAAVQN